MKIAIAAPSEIPARRANTVQVMKMAQALTGLGHAVYLTAPAAPATQRAQGASWDELKQHYGLSQAFDVEWLPANPRFRRYDFSLLSVRWARQKGCHLFYTRLPQAAALAGILGMPTIFEVHDLPQGTFGSLLFRSFLRSKGARRLVVITRALAADLQSLFGDRIHFRTGPGSPPEPGALQGKSLLTVIAPDGVDLERYASLPAPAQARQIILEKGNIPAGQRFLLQEERFIAGYTGHLYAGRGAELLLELAQRLPGMTFLIAGGEPQDVARLRSRVETGQLRNVLLTGFISNSELPVYQAACNVLLMPYQQHVAASSGGDIARYLSPMKLFEYLACQRPILSSNLPVLQEALNSQNALLLPADDPTAWATALKDLHSSPELRQRLADQARRDATQYTWENRARQILAGLDVDDLQPSK